MGNRVVARYRDGRLYKGTVSAFSPMRERFVLLTPQQKALEIRTADLKALFWVRTFAGDPYYVEAKSFENGANSEAHRQRVVCEFHDGEVLVGHSDGYDPARTGFFLTPVDGKSNNERVFVVNASTRRVLSAS